MNGRSHQSEDMIVRGVALFEHLTTHVFHPVALILFLGIKCQIQVGTFFLQIILHYNNTDDVT